MPGSRRKVLLVAAAAFVAVACTSTGTAASGGSAPVSAPDPSSATFKIERETITLVNGRAEREAAPGSATRITATLADQRATGDLDGDGRPDTVVVLLYQPGGSGTMYYVAALLNAAAGITATPAVQLGDRIKVTGLRLDGRAIVADLLDRAVGQPLSALPAVAVTRRFTLDRGALIAQ